MTKRKGFITSMLLIIMLLVTGIPTNAATAKVNSNSKTAVSQSKSYASANKQNGKDLKGASKSTVSKATYGTQKNVFMWEVRPKNGKNKNKKVYILGSVHLGNANVYPLDKRIENAFNESKNLVVEVDASKIDQKAYGQYILKYGMAASNKKLKNVIPADLYKKVGDIITKYGFKANVYDNFKPWVPYLDMLSLATSKEGYVGAEGIDIHFLNEAKTGKKKILELESADFQYKMFGSFSDSLQTMLLKGAVDEYEKGTATENSMDPLYNCWKSGDADGVNKLTFETGDNSKETKEFNEKVFYQRNIGMENKIEKYLKDNDTYFVVAGAGHMVGSKGIIALLKSKGYSVTQK